MLAAAMAALVLVPGGAAAEPLLTDEQTLADITLNIGNSENVLNPVADVSTGPNETIDLNWMTGAFNLQDNDFVLSFTSEDAQSLLRQSLLGESFNLEAAELSAAQAHNSVTADISAPDGVEI